MGGGDDAGGGEERMRLTLKLLQASRYSWNIFLLPNPRIVPPKTWDMWGEGGIGRRGGGRGGGED